MRLRTSMILRQECLSKFGSASPSLLTQYEKLVPIRGTEHVKYLSENADADKIVLEKSEVELLNRCTDIIGHDTTAGIRPCPMIDEVAADFEEIKDYLKQLKTDRKRT